jgi:hypothetical protein
MGAPLWLWGSLAAAAGLFVVSRTDKGRDVIAGALDRSLPRGIRNNNPGNIDWIADPAKRWNGMLRKETAAEGGRFGVFDTAANGVRAIGQEILLDDRRGVRTVKGLISSWAPSNENNTAAYIDAVATSLGIKAEQTIDVRSYLPRMAKAIIKHENSGQCPYSDEQLQRWVFS